MDLGQPQPQPQPTPPPTGGTGATTITITGAGVSTRDLTVARGARVTFVNNDSVPHDMSSGDVTAHYSGSASRFGVCALVTLTDTGTAKRVDVEQIALG